MTSPTDPKSMAILVRLSTRFVNSLREGGGSVKLVRRGAVGLLLLVVLVLLEALRTTLLLLLVVW